MTAVRASGLALLVLAATTGCLTATATIDPGGGGTLVYRYFPPKHATHRSERARLSSPHVRVEQLVGGTTTTATLAFDDVTALPTAEAFRDLVVERRREGDLEALRIVLPPMPERFREAALDAPLEPEKDKGPEVTLTLPGAVVSATPAARIDGRTVAWTISLRDFARLDRWELDATWRPPGETVPHSM